MVLLRKSHDKAETHLFACNCQDSHYLRIERDTEWGDCNWVEIDDHYRARRWRDRISMAVKLLLGKECVNSAFILDDATAAELLEVLQGPFPTASVMD